MHIISTLTLFVSHHEFLAYGLLFIAVVIEGELTLIFSGVLAHLGILAIGAALTFGFLGAIGKTIAGYYLGVFIKTYIPENRFFTYAEHRVLYFLPRFKEKPFWSILISKFIYGINHLAIIFAGYIRANFKLFFQAEIISSVPWVLFMFLLGYFFSHAAFGISHDVGKAALVILVFLIGFMIFQHIVNLFIEVSEESKSKNNE